jgi:methylmalonyl-CoA carboxyltransferase small subunit
LKLKLTVDGKLYEVDVEVAEAEQPRPSYIPPAGQVSRQTSSESAPQASTPSAGDDQDVDESKVCRSPIAGVVVRAPAQVGQEIQVDDVLLVLEAMKMETLITAPVAGKVAKINVAVGDSVQARQVLVEFE